MAILLIVVLSESGNAALTDYGGTACCLLVLVIQALTLGSDRAPFVWP
jgi:hypothetical protein